jgi:hypothetical protein
MYKLLLVFLLTFGFKGLFAQQQIDADWSLLFNSYIYQGTTLYPLGDGGFLVGEDNALLWNMEGKSPPILRKNERQEIVFIEYFFSYQYKSSIVEKLLQKYGDPQIYRTTPEGNPCFGWVGEFLTIFASEYLAEDGPTLTISFYRNPKN